ncbi:MAG: RdgB/HAM1 family non-canonical purine NTP pyrophosphatase [Candidatus Uhrbacteria bacterium]|nr:RdgB/HAM1 family non-canonical purine NTP pyrophosphatase [Candidatus Uhrbacteria bacterium]
MRLIFATHNSGKLAEMRSILAGLLYEIESAREAGVMDEVVEDGLTFADNALKKAVEVCKATNALSLADDSGVCINALDGAPGVYTARWAGEGASDTQLVEHTLEQMSGKTNRKASFVCVAALVTPDGRTWTFEGRVDGTLTTEPRGTARPKLPYDAIFIPEGETRTFAEMPEEEKHAMSHRGRAMRKVREFLESTQI